MKRKVTVAIVGLGGRGEGVYAKCQHLFPDEMEIVAIADIVPEKVAKVAKEYGVSPDRCYNSAEELLKEDRLADVMFICTQDRQHVGHAVPALKKGYHLLVEKPISPDAAECKRLAALAKQYKRQVVICHVLRYTPFYQKIKEILNSGKIGDIVSIQAMENVAYWHQAHSFVRGNWRNSETTSPMVLQKCCHDMDIFVWLTGKKCKRVSSFGSLNLFREDKAPEGSTDFCLGGCKVKKDCPYDAEKIYITNEKTGVEHGAGFPSDIVTLNPTVDSVREALKAGPYGRCVYHCDNNVVDHQIMALEMEDGSTIDFTMCAFTNKVGRAIKIMGTKGDIEANNDDNVIDVCAFGGKHEVIDVNTLATDFSGHGGGDNRLVKDLLDLVQNESSVGAALTSIDGSTESHLIALALEESRIHGGKTINMDEFVAQF
ncbi:MAG: Gfo/Idh/MocA family oxidoreductase [Oscillospiraceae bacterium]